MTKNLKGAASTKPVGTTKAETAGESAAMLDGTSSPAKPPSKIDQVIALLSRPMGATLDELVIATGWQRHTTRAALTGLKKKGRNLSSEKTAGVRRYRMGKSS